jgi:hypothetical protein
MIEWVDSVQPQSSWRFLADVEPSEAVKCYSVGWLISDGDTKALAPNMGIISEGEVQVSGVISIPTRCIIRIVPISEPKTI